MIEKQDGLSQYIISLLNNMPEYAFELFEFQVLINENVKRKELWSVFNTREYKVIKAKIAPIGPRRDWDMFRYFNKHKNDFDLFHSTSNQYPLFLKCLLCTLHLYLNEKIYQHYKQKL